MSLRSFWKFAVASATTSSRKSVSFPFQRWIRWIFSKIPNIVMTVRCRGSKARLFSKNWTKCQWLSKCRSTSFSAVRALLWLARKNSWRRAKKRKNIPMTRLRSLLATFQVKISTFQPHPNLEPFQMDFLTLRNNCICSPMHTVTQAANMISVPDSVSMSKPSSVLTRCKTSWQQGTPPIPLPYKYNCA